MLQRNKKTRHSPRPPCATPSQSAHTHKRSPNRSTHSSDGDSIHARKTDTQSSRPQIPNKKSHFSTTPKLAEPPRLAGGGGWRGHVLASAPRAWPEPAVSFDLPFRHLEDPGPLFESGGSLTRIRRCGSRLGWEGLADLSVPTGLFAGVLPLCYTLGRSRTAVGAEAGSIHRPTGRPRRLGTAKTNSAELEITWSAFCHLQFNLQEISERAGGVGEVAKHRTRWGRKELWPTLGCSILETSSVPVAAARGVSPSSSR